MNTHRKMKNEIPWKRDDNITIYDVDNITISTNVMCWLTFWLVFYSQYTDVCQDNFLVAYRVEVDRVEISVKYSSEYYKESVYWLYIYGFIKILIYVPNLFLSQYNQNILIFIRYINIVYLLNIYICIYVYNTILYFC